MIASGDIGIEDQTVMSGEVVVIPFQVSNSQNILSFEADISYDKLLDLEEANNYLETTDVAIVVGANDVVNPSAIDDPNSKIYGMPILDLSKTKNVVVLKRSMNPGYAGIQNPLFFKDNTKMLFGDAKKTLEVILKGLKDL